MKPDFCPRCGKERTIAGIIDEMTRQGSFQPEGIPWLRHLLWRFGQSTAARMEGQFRACLGCGLVWNSLDPEQLRAVLEREGIGHAGDAQDTEPV